MEEAAVFAEFLRKRNLRLTNQREHILNVFLKLDRHLTVEELYDKVKRKNPEIGQATVFRTLKLLCGSGLARQVELGDKKSRFEHKFGHKHHDHLVCIGCGLTVEVMEPRIEELQNLLCERFSFSPQRHKMQIYGFCKKCRRRGKREG